MTEEEVSTKKVYPARMFNRASIACPSCHKLFKEGADKCPRCGFDAHRAVQQFPFTPPVMERLMDHAGIVDEELAAELDSAVDALAGQFPQLGLYFCTLELDDPMSLSEFGFWMMNACRLQDGQQELERAWSILVLMDVKRGLLSLTPGYAIEAFVDDAAWETALQMMGRQLAAGDRRAALIGFVRDAERLLRDSARSVNVKVRRK